MSGGGDILIFLLMTAAAIFILCIPLVFKLVPPNRWYGFRTRKTLSSPEIWYPANVFAGYSLMVAMVIAIATFFLMPLTPVTAAVVLSTLVLGATAVSFWYLKRIV